MGEKVLADIIDPSIGDNKTSFSLLLLTEILKMLFFTIETTGDYPINQGFPTFFLLAYPQEEKIKVAYTLVCVNE